MNKINPSDLEAAMPSFLQKLKVMQKGLTPEEKVIFGEIIQSAAKHTVLVQAKGEHPLDSNKFAKPMSIHATLKMKKTFLALPKTLGVKVSKS